MCSAILLDLNFILHCPIVFQEQAQNNQTMTIEIEAGMSRQQVKRSYLRPLLTQRFFVRACVRLKIMAVIPLNFAHFRHCRRMEIDKWKVAFILITAEGRGSEIHLDSLLYHRNVEANLITRLDFWFLSIDMFLLSSINSKVHTMDLWKLSYVVLMKGAYQSKEAHLGPLK